jgi:LicD family
MDGLLTRRAKLVDDAEAGKGGAGGGEPKGPKEYEPSSNLAVPPPPRLKYLLVSAAIVIALLGGLAIPRHLRGFGSGFWTLERPLVETRQPPLAGCRESDAEVAERLKKSASCGGPEFSCAIPRVCPHIAEACLAAFAEFTAFTAEHGVRWWCAEGTLMSVVRSGGFFPWDDDFDVGMFREDLERLVHAAAADPRYGVATDYPDGTLSFFARALQLAYWDKAKFFNVSRAANNHRWLVDRATFPAVDIHVFIDADPVDTMWMKKRARISRLRRADLLPLQKHALRGCAPDGGDLIVNLPANPERFLDVSYNDTTWRTKVVSLNWDHVTESALTPRTYKVSSPPSLDNYCRVRG